MIQRLDEWNNVNERRLKYHQGQWTKPYRSTIHFSDFIENELQHSASVIDLACGTGSATHYLASQFKNTQFLGLDICHSHIEFASAFVKENNIPNLRFEYDDWYNLTTRNHVDGVISLQTLLGLPDWEEALRQIIQKTNCRWIAFSSLFYPGEISCKIEVTEHKDNGSYFYNVHSIPQIQKFVKKYNYEVAKFEKFEMDIDLPKPPTDDFMSTYTVQVVDEHSKTKRIQISGPLLMNWGFLMLKRSTHVDKS